MKHLSMFTGTPQADGYAGYDQVYEDGRIQEAGCIAHVRRKFYDLYVAHKSPLAAEALERIEALYAIEKEIRDVYQKSGVKIRNELSLPLMESLKQWLEETLLKLSEKSLTINRIEELLPPQSLGFALFLS